MDPQIGSFSSFLYFLFCPVLLYRDRYPRKPPNFKKASVYFIQFISMVGVSYILLFDFGIPESMKWVYVTPDMDDFSHLYLHRRDTLMQVCVQNLLLGFLILTSGHTCLIHGWTHCWAELLGFADQTFYEVVLHVLQSIPTAYILPYLYSTVHTFHNMRTSSHNV